MPKLLDLFCGAGGAGVGYHRAGFDVTGVDIKDQPNYPFMSYTGDAVAMLREWIADGFINEFDAIHASPPCQGYTAIRSMNKYAKEYPMLVEPVRELLRASGLPWIIENVPGAPMDAMRLCGSSFGLKVRRHRLFESSHVMLAPSCQHGPERPVAVYGDHPEKCPTGKINRAWTLEHGREAMGIDWMNWRELCESIPPAYTEWLGHQLFAVLMAEDALALPGGK